MLFLIDEEVDVNNFRIIKSVIIIYEKSDQHYFMTYFRDLLSFWPLTVPL